MRKLILLFMSLFMIMTGTSFANDINNGNYFLECKIGSLGLRDSFDMKQLNQLFGNMSKPAYQVIWQYEQTCISRWPCY